MVNCRKYVLYRFSRISCPIPECRWSRLDVPMKRLWVISVSVDFRRGEWIMERRTRCLRLALSAFLTSGGASAFAERLPPATGGLPSGLNATSNATIAAFSQWNLIEDPLTGLESPTPSKSANTTPPIQGNWVQLAAQAELSPPARSDSDSNAGSNADTIKIVTPIAISDSESANLETDKIDRFPQRRDIRGISLDIRPPAGTLPPDSTDTGNSPPNAIAGYEPRPWQDDAYFWESPIFCHRPLYFEERSLERHGVVRYPMLRPVISGAHFFTSYVALPYQVVMYPPFQCVPSSEPSSLQVKHSSTLDHRNAKAVAAQTAAVAGMILLVP